MEEPSLPGHGERDFMACPMCNEFVSIRSSGVGTRGHRRFVCAFCGHRFLEADGAPLTPPAPE
jgi:transposase-like protein